MEGLCLEENKVGRKLELEAKADANIKTCESLPRLGYSHDQHSEKGPVLSH